MTQHCPQTVPVTPSTAAMAALAFSAEDGNVPGWIHLVPAGPMVETVPGDPRGPFSMNDAAAVIAASFERSDRLPIDENHATDFAAKFGTPSPARGWITKMEARPDGIWGQVEWTDEGRALVASKAYRAISPVIGHADKRGSQIKRILRAALVNNPGLSGLTTLHMENTDMDLSKALAELLGLGEGADGDAILAAVKKLKGDGGDSSAMSAEMGEIATALGCDEGADHTAILAAATAAVASGGTATELSAKVTALSAELGGLKAERAKEKAEAFVDAAIAEGRVGLNRTNRDDYIAHFQADEASCRKMIAGMTILSSDSVITAPLLEGQSELSARDLADKATAYIAEQAKVGKTVDIVAAMAAIQETAR